MIKLSLRIPVKTIESVDRRKGYLSVNKWIWRAIDKVLAAEEEEEEEQELKGVKGLEGHQAYEHLHDTTASLTVEPKQLPPPPVASPAGGVLALDRHYREL